MIFCFVFVSQILSEPKHFHHAKRPAPLLSTATTTTSQISDCKKKKKHFSGTFASLHNLHADDDDTSLNGKKNLLRSTLSDSNYSNKRKIISFDIK